MRKKIFMIVFVLFAFLSLISCGEAPAGKVRDSDSTSAKITHNIDCRQLTISKNVDYFTCYTENNNAASSGEIANYIATKQNGSIRVITSIVSDHGGTEGRSWGYFVIYQP